MRILYVTNGFPFPLTSGYLRPYFLIRAPSARHSITLLSIVGADYEADHAEALAPFTERVETFPSADRSRSRGRKALARLDALRGSRADGPAQRLGRAAASLARVDSFDAVLFSGKRTAPALPFIGGLPLVVDICDTASARIRGSIRYAAPLRRPLLALEAFEVRRAERRLAAAGDALLFASVRDRGLLLADIRDRGLSPRTLVVPNGVDVDYWQRSARELGRTAIVFTGKMDYPPNEDAALVLAETVFPAVRRSVRDAELWIVGRDPTDRLLAAGKRAGVTVTGEVPDVRPYLERAAVFAAPLRFGAGIQNKVLEAMAMEVPAVVSPLAGDGLRTEDDADVPVTVGRTADEIAAGIVERLEAARHGTTPDSRSRAYVAAHFAWAESARKVEGALAAASGAEAIPAAGRAEGC
jgi:glycosyltransferase involved in cell wall biosynthesis